MSGVAIDFETQGANSAKKDLDGIIRALDKLKNSSNNSKEALGGISAKNIRIVKKDTDAAKRSVDKFGNSGKKAGTEMSAMMNKIRNSVILLSSTFVAFKGIQIFHRMADDLVNVQNTLKLVIKDTHELYKAQNKVYKLSRETRTDFASTATGFSNLTKGLAKFNLEQERILKISRTIAQATALSSGDMESKKAGLVQLGQGLSSELRGQELRSVFEQLNYLGFSMQSVFKMTSGELIKFAEKGNLTGMTLVKMFEDMADKTASDFKDLRVTVSMASSQVVASLKMLFAGINQYFGFSENSSRLLLKIADAIDGIGSRLTTSFFHKTTKFRNFLNDISGNNKLKALSKISEYFNLDLRSTYQLEKLYNGIATQIKRISDLDITSKGFGKDAEKIGENLAKGIVSGISFVFERLTSLISFDKIDINAIFESDFADKARAILATTMHFFRGFFLELYEVASRSIKKLDIFIKASDIFKSMVSEIKRYIKEIDPILQKIVIFGNDIKYTFLDVYDFFKSMIDRVIGYTGRLDTVLQRIAVFGNTIKDIFFDVYDAVIGHSYWPDMIDGILTETKRLGGALDGVKGFVASVKHQFSRIKDKLIPDDFFENLTNRMGASIIGGLMAVFGGGIFRQAGIAYLISLFQTPLLATLSTTLPKIANLVAGSFGVFFSEIFKGFVRLFDMVIALLPAFVKGLAIGLLGIPEGLIDAFSKIPNFIKLIVATSMAYLLGVPSAIVAAIAGVGILITNNFTSAFMISALAISGIFRVELGRLLGFFTSAGSAAGVGFSAGFGKKFRMLALIGISTVIFDSISMIEGLTLATPLLLMMLFGDAAGRRLTMQALSLIGSITGDLVRNTYKLFRLAFVKQKSPFFMFSSLFDTKGIPKAKFSSLFRPILSAFANAYSNFKENAAAYGAGSMSFMDAIFKGSKKVDFGKTFRDFFRQFNQTNVGKGFKQIKDAVVFNINHLYDILRTSSTGISQALSVFGGAFVTFFNRLYQTVISGFGAITGLFRRYFAVFLIIGGAFTAFSSTAAEASTGVVEFEFSLKSLPGVLAKIALSIVTVSLAMKSYTRYVKAAALYTALFGAKGARLAGLKSVGNMFADIFKGLNPASTKSGAAALNKLKSSLRGFDFRGIVEGFKLVGKGSMSWARTAGLALKVGKLFTITGLVGTIGAIGIWLLGKGDTLRDKIKGLYDSLRGIIGLSAKTDVGRRRDLEKTLKTREIGDKKVDFRYLIHQVDFSKMTAEDVSVLKEIGSEADEALDNLNKLYKTQGYLTSKQIRDLEKIEARMNRVLVDQPAKANTSYGRSVEKGLIEYGTGDNSPIAMSERYFLQKADDLNFALELFNERLRKVWGGSVKEVDDILNSAILEEARGGVSAVGFAAKEQFLWLNDFLFKAWTDAAQESWGNSGVKITGAIKDIWRDWYSRFESVPPKDNARVLASMGPYQKSPERDELQKAAGQKDTIYRIDEVFNDIPVKIREQMEVAKKVVLLANSDLVDASALSKNNPKWKALNKAYLDSVDKLVAVNEKGLAEGIKAYNIRTTAERFKALTTSTFDATGVTLDPNLSINARQTDTLRNMIAGINSLIDDKPGSDAELSALNAMKTNAISMAKAYIDLISKPSGEKVKAQAGMGYFGVSETSLTAANQLGPAGGELVDQIDTLYEQLSIAEAEYTNRPTDAVRKRIESIKDSLRGLVFSGNAFGNIKAKLKEIGGQFTDNSLTVGSFGEYSTAIEQAYDSLAHLTSVEENRDSTLPDLISASNGYNEALRRYNLFLEINKKNTLANAKGATGFNLLLGEGKTLPIGDTKQWLSLEQDVAAAESNILVYRKTGIGNLDELSKSYHRAVKALAAFNEEASVNSRLSDFNEIFKVNFDASSLGMFTAEGFNAISDLAMAVKKRLKEAFEAGKLASTEFAKELNKLSRIGTYLTFFKDAEEAMHKAIVGGAKTAFAAMGDTDLNFRQYLNIDSSYRKSAAVKTASLDTFEKALELDLPDNLKNILASFGSGTELSKVMSDFMGAADDSIKALLNDPMERVATNTAETVAALSSILGALTGKPTKDTAGAPRATRGATAGATGSGSTGTGESGGGGATGVDLTSAYLRALLTRQTLDDSTVKEYLSGANDYNKLRLTSGGGIDDKTLNNATSKQFTKLIELSSKRFTAQQNLMSITNDDKSSTSDIQTALSTFDFFDDQMQNVIDKLREAGETGQAFADTMKGTFKEGLSGLIKGDVSIGDFGDSLLDKFTGGIMDDFVGGFSDSIFESIGGFLKGSSADSAGLGKSVGSGLLGLFSTKTEEGAEGAEKATDSLGTGLGKSTGGLLKSAGSGLLGLFSTKTKKGAEGAEGTEDAEKAMDGLGTGLDKVFQEGTLDIAGIMKKLPFDLGDVFSKGLGSLLDLFKGGAGDLAGMFTGISKAFGFANGGRITGPGTGTSDSIMAMVSNGEYVVNAAATRRNLPLLEAINAGKIPHFATGGGVGVKQTQQSVMQQEINVHITGDISRQTKSEIYKMLPSIASGVNTYNREKGIK